MLRLLFLLGCVHVAEALSTCTQYMCEEFSLMGDGGIDIVGTVLLWVSHIMLLLPALMYTLAIGEYKEPTTKSLMCHHLDPLLAEKEIKTAEQVYEAFAKCEDPVVRHLGFFMITQARQQGAFQFALGLCIFSNIILMPPYFRTPIHVIIGTLQIIAGLTSRTHAKGGPLSDLVIKFGGAKPGEVADNEKPSDMVTLRNSKEFLGASNGDAVAHFVLGLINVGLGVAFLVIFLDYVKEAFKSLI